MIGYYVHHHGRGHLTRAGALAASWRREGGPEVTGLSSLPRPPGWDGGWVQLPPDDDVAVPVDATAHGQLHWAPLGDPGIRARAAAISAWLAAARPAAVVVDVSAETALLVRLHGVPVVAVVLPGRRGDPAHLTAFRAATALVGFWPGRAVDMAPGLPDDVARRIVPVGAVSRFVPRPAPRRPGRCAVLLQGSGGEALSPRTADELAAATGWEWTVLGGGAPWVADPSAVLAGADVVVSSAGQSSLADVAALRRPAVVVPSPRPFGEQYATATVLAGGSWPAVVVDTAAEAFTSATLERAAGLDGDRWADWCDGGAAGRLRAVVDSVGA